jgi:hypothetical protein
VTVLPRVNFVHSCQIQSPGLFSYTPSVRTHSFVFWLTTSKYLRWVLFVRSVTSQHLNGQVLVDCCKRQVTTWTVRSRVIVAAVCLSPRDTSSEVIACSLIVSTRASPCLYPLAGCLWSKCVRLGTRVIWVLVVIKSYTSTRAQCWINPIRTTAASLQRGYGDRTARSATALSLSHWASGTGHLESL